MSRMPLLEMMQLGQSVIRTAQANALRTIAKSLEPHADETMQVSELIELLNMRADTFSK